jgi:hypothetical protein
MTSLHFIAASQLQPRPLAWLWPSRFALGKLALLEGDPGLGKSLLALDLCARLSKGTTWPDSGPSIGPAGSIVLNGEDNAEDTITPRLQALGADLDRIYLPDRRGDDLASPLWLPADVGLLDEALARTSAKLVIIDPLMAFLDPSVLTASDQSVRRALAPLAELAARHTCAILLIRHLRKSTSGEALYRGGGSIGFVAACRSAWLAARDPGDRANCILAQVKNNLAPRQPSLGYAVAVAEKGPPSLSWLGTRPWTANQLQARLNQKPRQGARELLQEMLAQGPQPSDDIWAAARRQGLANRTLYRARKELHIQVVRVKMAGTVVPFWLLPGQRLPGSIPTTAIVPDLEEWLGPLREESLVSGES